MAGLLIRDPVQIGAAERDVFGRRYPVQIGDFDSRFERLALACHSDLHSLADSVVEKSL